MTEQNPADMSPEIRRAVSEVLNRRVDDWSMDEILRVLEETNHHGLWGLINAIATRDAALIERAKREAYAECGEACREQLDKREGDDHWLGVQECIGAINLLERGGDDATAARKWQDERRQKREEALKREGAREALGEASVEVRRQFDGEVPERILDDIAGVIYELSKENGATASGFVDVVLQEDRRSVGAPRYWFIEIEDGNGNSINAGRWLFDQGLPRIRIPVTARYAPEEKP